MLRVVLHAGDGNRVMLDVENKKPETILSELTAVAGKTE
jgi:hypothetical protein